MQNKLGLRPRCAAVRLFLFQNPKRERYFAGCKIELLFKLLNLYNTEFIWLFLKFAAEFRFAAA